MREIRGFHPPRERSAVPEEGASPRPRGRPGRPKAPPEGLARPPNAAPEAAEGLARPPPLGAERRGAPTT
jgi:hypothetical protein